jgi:hypothetical protein
MMRQRLLRFVSIALLLAACAQGTGDGITTGHPDAHVPGSADANFNAAADARPGTPDADLSTPDAFVDPPDADTGGGCSTSAECAATNPLTCCYQNACVLGVEFPAPIGCLPLN